MAPSVRPATAADRPTLEIIRRQAIEASWSESVEQSAYAEYVAEGDDELWQWLHEDRFVVLLAETAVTPVAYGAIDPVEGVILALFTAPDYMREGYGSRVLGALEDRSQSHTISMLAPIPAVDFFRQHDYEPVGPPTDDPIPRVPVQKQLAGDPDL